MLASNGCGLHANADIACLRGNIGNPDHQAPRTICGIGEGKVLEQRFLHAFTQQGCHMVILADIDSKVEHLDHRYLLDFG